MTVPLMLTAASLNFLGINHSEWSNFLLMKTMRQSDNDCQNEAHKFRLVIAKSGHSKKIPATRNANIPVSSVHNHEISCAVN